MFKEKTTEETLQYCQQIIKRTAEMVEDFIQGKEPQKYGSTKLARDLAAETGLNFSLVQPLVSLFIIKDARVESNKGRFNGGLCLTDKGKEYKAATYQ